jgi:hypothetical protein
MLKFSTCRHMTHMTPGPMYCRTMSFKARSEHMTEIRPGMTFANPAARCRRKSYARHELPYTLQTLQITLAGTTALLEGTQCTYDLYQTRYDICKRAARCRRKSYARHELPYTFQTLRITAAGITALLRGTQCTYDCIRARYDICKHAAQCRRKSYA